jgi:hypothetical protein
MSVQRQTFTPLCVVISALVCAALQAAETADQPVSGSELTPSVPNAAPQSGPPASGSEPLALPPQESK